MTQASTNSTFTNSALSITGGAARTKLENALIETLAIDPTNFTEARQRMWINTVDGHIKYTGNAGVTVKTVTNTDDGPTIFFFDNFDRANSNTTLGTSTSGQAWTVVTGTWGISNNEAYNVSDFQNDAAVVTPTGVSSSYTVSCDVKGTISAATPFSIAEISISHIDVNNLIAAYLYNGNTVLAKIDSGTASNLATSATTTSNNTVYTISIVRADSNIKVYVNGVLKIDHTLSAGDAAKFTSNKVGMIHAKTGTPATSARWENFFVTANA